MVPEGMEGRDFDYPNAGIPPVQPGVRPPVDPEAQGEVDPSRYEKSDTIIKRKL